MADHHVWRGTSRHRRGNGEYLTPGDTFDATERELDAFGDLIETVDGDGGGDESDDDGEDSTDAGGAIPDPADLTVDEVRAFAADATEAEVDAMLAAEMDGDSRTTAIEALEAALSSG